MNKKTIIPLLRKKKKKKRYPREYLKLILIKAKENRILYLSRHLAPGIETNSLEKELEQKKKEIRNKKKKLNIRQSKR